MAEFLHVRIWEKKKKRNRNYFYWRIIKCLSVVHNIEVLGHFARESYAWRLDIVQNFSYLILWHVISKYILENI